MKTKKLIISTLVLICLLACVPVQAQTQLQKVVIPEKTVKILPQQIKYVKINSVTDSIVAKDTVRALVIENVKKDSVIQAATDTIRAKNNELIKFQDYFKNELWNGQNPFIFYTAFVFAFIGLLFMWLCKTYFGAEQNTGVGTTITYKWSVAFGAHNIVKNFVGFILATLTIYLTLYLFPIVSQVSIVTNTYALVIGAGWQIFAKKLMKFFETKTQTKNDQL